MQLWHCSLNLLKLVIVEISSHKVFCVIFASQVLVLPNRERAMSALPVSVVCEDAQVQCIQIMKLCAFSYR